MWKEFCINTYLLLLSMLIGVKWPLLQLKLWYFIFNRFCPSISTSTDTESDQKFFHDQTFFATKHFFRAKIFSDQKLFPTKNLLRPKIYCDQKIIATKNIFWPKIFSDQKYFPTKNIFRPKIFLIKIFLPKIVFRQKNL